MGSEFFKKLKSARAFNTYILPVAACLVLAMAYTNCSGGFQAQTGKVLAQLSEEQEDLPPADVAAPVLTIGKKPAAEIKADHAEIEFSATDNVSQAADIKFYCALDASDYSLCTSPKSFADLTVGDHVIKIKASDKAGNISNDGTVSFKFTKPTLETPKIMMLGDSITEGGAEARIRFRALLNGIGQKYQFVGSMGNPTDPNEGHSGWTTADIKGGNIDKWTKDHRPDIVMIHLGTNDIWQRKSLNDAAANMREIVATIFENCPNAVVFVAKILPMYVPEGGANVNTFNALVEDALGSLRSTGMPVIYVDMNTGFTNADMNDGVHPTQAGQQKLGDRWFKAFDEFF